MSDVTMSLSDTSAGQLQVGGISTSLACLAADELTAPDGSYVTTAAFPQYVATNQLEAEISTSLADIASTQPTTLDAAAHRIHT